jgi:hypothetical protein
VGETVVVSPAALSMVQFMNGTRAARRRTQAIASTVPSIDLPRSLLLDA